MTRHLVLVGCCGEKLSRIAPARQLYRSQLFKKAAAWADHHGDEWHVISAAYGLIAPDSQLAPYDRAMRDLSRDERQSWAESVAMSLDALARFHDVATLKITLLAGADYATWVPLVSDWCEVHQPMQGMQIGQRLQWLTQQGEQHELLLAEAS